MTGQVSIMLPRRNFLNWFLGTSVGAMAVSIIYPVLRYLVPPEMPEAQTAQTMAAREGELKPNEGKVFPFGGRPAILVRTEQGDYRAFSATCTHLNCTVQYRGDLKQLWCACHNGAYDLSGRNVSGPPPRPLESYRTHVANGEIVVSKT
jgi:cytochrome b6-f complex iron-sulfur subunit